MRIEIWVCDAQYCSFLSVNQGEPRIVWRATVRWNFLMCNKPTRRGITLIEVVVVLGITSLLMGFLLPGIQAARESARSHDCRHRMRQLAQAAHTFHDTHGALPAISNSLVGRPAFPGMLSAWAQLLPFLDQTTLYQQIDLDPGELGLGIYANPPSLTRPANQRLLKTGLPIARCPSDAVPTPGCSYRACVSAGPAKHRFSGIGAWVNDRSLDGIRLAEITDGFSQTAFISERIVGDFDGHVFTPAKDIYCYRPDLSAPFPYAPDDFAQLCRSRFSNPLPSEVSFSGATWLVNGLSFTHYNHTLAPNSEVPDCASEKIGMYSGAVSARSWHPNGVNVTFADGHVSFIAESIDLKVWRAIATRNGAESQQAPD